MQQQQLFMQQRQNFFQQQHQSNKQQLLALQKNESDADVKNFANSVNAIVKILADDDEFVEQVNTDNKNTL